MDLWPIDGAIDHIFLKKVKKVIKLRLFYRFITVFFKFFYEQKIYSSFGIRLWNGLDCKKLMRQK